MRGGHRNAGDSSWLSPCQVKVLPVSEKTRDYANEVAARFRAAGVRVKVDDRDEKIGYKIREARSIDRVPYMGTSLCVGVPIGSPS